MEIIVSLILGISIASIIFLLFFDKKSLLETRIKKIAKQQRQYTKSIAKNIAEIIGSYGKKNKKNQPNNNHQEPLLNDI